MGSQYYYYYVRYLLNEGILGSLGKVDMEPFMLLDVSGGGTAPVPPGLELQQEILASFTFPVEPQRV